MKRKRRIKVSSVIIYLVVLLLGLSCLLPLLNTVAASFSNRDAATANRVGIIPVGFNLFAYRKLLKDEQFWRSFMISVVRVLLGTALNIFLVVTMAYPLSKNKREFKAQGIYMKISLFAMLFYGGLVPTYLVVKGLHLIDTMGALILPGAVGVGNVILMMNFFRGVPKDLEEAAEIDGANPLKILLNVFLPVSKPCIATIILFCIVGHWNDYFAGILYMTKIKHYPLQTYIHMVSGTLDISRVTDPKKIREYVELSERTVGSAKIVVSTIPLLMIYPVLQRYFTTGLVVGAVKE